jgi:hypothetical protein
LRTESVISNCVENVRVGKRIEIYWVPIDTYYRFLYSTVICHSHSLIPMTIINANFIMPAITIHTLEKAFAVAVVVVVQN